MTSGWVKKPRWETSHFLRDDDQRTRHNDNEVGRTACGMFITLDRYLTVKPAGTETCNRCRHLHPVGDDQ